MTPAVPICEACEHLGPFPDRPGLRCAAFPDGVPDAIYLEGFDHRKPFEGDGGVRFELDEGDPQAPEVLAAFEAARGLATA